MSAEEETLDSTWHEVLLAVLKQTWWAALLAAALMMWDYTTAQNKPALATLAKDSFLTFSFLMFFGNLWQRTKKHVEDKAELKSIRVGVKSVHELLMELQALGMQVPNRAWPEVDVSATAGADSGVSEPGPVDDEDGDEGKHDSRFSRTIEYIDEPVQVVRQRVLQELSHSPLAALIHVAIAIEGQLRRITGASGGRKSSSPIAAVRRLREMGNVDPKIALLVSNFLQLRNVAVHEPNTTRTTMVEAVSMGVAILERLEQLPDGKRR
jgi:uncharacterized protein YutE (UPF0331/DUF86 family)